MFKAEFSKNFKKQYSKLIKNNVNLKKRIDVALLKLCENPETISHKVGQYWSSRVTADIRIIWEYKRGELVLLLLKIGGHDNVY
jgi:mRNA-degrading endonuclease YafQ of YafQ-DinJ toxin-antitoxin module